MLTGFYIRLSYAMLTNDSSDVSSAILIPVYRYERQNSDIQKNKKAVIYNII